MPSRVADILLAAGRDAARAREQTGQIWGGAIQQLGHLPEQALQEQQQRQRLGLETQRVGLETSHLGMQIDAMKQAQEGQRRANDIIAGLPRTPEGDYDTAALTQRFAEGQVPLDMSERFVKAADGLNTLRASWRKNHTEHLADLADLVIQHHAPKTPWTPDEVHIGVAAAKELGLATDADIEQVTQALGAGADPERFVHGIRSLGSKYKEAQKPFTTPRGGVTTTLERAETGQPPLATGQPFSKTAEEVALDAATVGTPEETPTAKQSKATLDLTQGPAMAARDETARHDAEMERIDRLRVGRQAAADAETARHHKAVEGLGAAGGETPAKDIADAIEKGLQPPDTRGLFRMAAPVRAELARRGYDLTHAQLDYQATQRHLATLNGAQQTRLRQAIGTASESLGVIEDLAKQWDGGGFPPLNRVKLTLAKNGGLGPKAQQIATNLEAQITDVTSELGNVYMGGNSPTDQALQLAGKNLSADWNRDQLLSAVKLARTNLQIRNNSIANASAITSSGVVPPLAPPSGAAGAREGEVKPIPGYPGTEQTFKNGKWIRTK